MISALKTLYQQFAARRVFDHWADTYEGDVKNHQYSAAAAVREALLPHLGADSQLVDLGVGTGLIWEGVDIPEDAEITGLDMSSAMMERASVIPELGPLYLCDVGRHDWPVYNETMDMIVAAGLFEYLTLAMARHALSEAHRTLKPGGRFIFTYIPGLKNEEKSWDGRSGNILSCRFDPAWIAQQDGFSVETHTEPFAGSVYDDGQSYDYRLITLRKTA